MRRPALVVLAVVGSLTGCRLFWPNTLTIVVDPPGAGVVNTTPRRVMFGRGETVKLTAVPSGDYSLEAFLVDGQTVPSAGDTLSLTMDQDTTVTAVFTTESYGLLVAPTETGAEVSVDVGSNPSDVYLIFTNTGTTAHPLPTLAAAKGVFAAPPPTARRPDIQRPAHPMLLRDRALDERSAELRALRAPMRSVHPGQPAPPPMRDAVGQGGQLYNSDSIPALVNAACRALVEVGDHTLSVWVADASYGTEQWQVDQSMVDGLASAFLRDGENNDIYDWITDVFGDEWGPDASQMYEDLIEDNDTVTILLYDIDGDASTFEQDGGIVGLFWLGDTYVPGYYAGLVSNGRLMFYLDAPMLSLAEDSTWEITDEWPEEVVSTLAHEFQHMIHWYQKDVLRLPLGMQSEVWLNEMCSMVAEDLVSDKLGTPGPRGVDPVEWGGSTGPAANTDGWLPLYNWDNFTPLAPWNYDDVYPSYAVNYAFGAYLARNFGGAALFRGIVQSNSNGRAAITGALAAGGFAETFAVALREWAVAALLSSGQMEQPRRYNAGDWMDAGLSGSDYRLGSIDLYRYRYKYYPDGSQVQEYWDGPYVFSQLPSGSLDPTASLYYLAATDATGTVSFTLEMHPDLCVEVVVKR